MKRINLESDFILALTLPDGYEGNFKVVLRSTGGSTELEASRIDGVLTNVSEHDGQLAIVCKSHGFKRGRLTYKAYTWVDNEWASGLVTCKPVDDGIMLVEGRGDGNDPAELTAVLPFSKGEKGDKGDQGDRGPQGEKGETGERGPQGVQGVQGETGATGVGIKSITKTATSGLVDTYTITMTDGSTAVFKVTNGKDGEGASISIVQSTGTSTTAVMSQKAVTDALGEKVTEADVKSLVMDEAMSDDDAPHDQPYSAALMQRLFTALVQELQQKADTSALAGKQDALTAGDNITIEGNVISASGGGSSSTSEWQLLHTFTPVLDEAWTSTFELLEDTQEVIIQVVRNNGYASSNTGTMWAKIANYTVAQTITTIYTQTLIRMEIARPFLLTYSTSTNNVMSGMGLTSRWTTYIPSGKWNTLTLYSTTNYNTSTTVKIYAR